MNSSESRDSYRLRRGASPLLVSMPHIGTEMPPELAPGYVPRALTLEDTDWHLDRLYDFLPDLDATVLQARISRYVIDLNRPPDDAPMYPGAANTELCPTRFFSGEALYREGCAPTDQERGRRRAVWWQPYHSVLAAEIERIRALHGHVLLWDAHSIRSVIPWLFEGRLPDLNIGTAGGASADGAIADAVARSCAAAPGVSSVLNGRFKGGHITRHYGRPQQQVHAIQLELCQCSYMQELPPFAFDPQRAAQIAPLLRRMLEQGLAAAATCHGR